MKQNRKLTVLGCCLLLFSLAAPTMAQQIPDGYSLLTDPSVSGGHLVATRTGTGSASDLLARALREVSGFFRGMPEVVAGFCDLDNRSAQAVFRSTLQGAPIGGVAYALVGSGTGTTGFVFDSPQAIRQSLPQLMALTGGGGAPPVTSATPARNWRDTPFPDGSGSMRLPQGWVITFAQKGMASAEGPHGIIERGLWTPVTTRAAANQFANVAGIPYQGPVFDPIDPVSVLHAYTEFMNSANQQRGIAPRRILRLVEVAPAPPVPGYSQAAYIDYEYEMSGKRYRGIQYVMLGDIGPTGIWVLYTTYVASPSETFPQNLPVLIEIWGSARTSRGEIIARLDEAMNNLREAGEIYRQASGNRQVTQQRTHYKWIEAIQGTRIVEDSLTGEQGDVNLGWSKEIVQRMNQAEGHERYREIPLWQLNR
ncbi:MAG: hypothetical protein OQK97_09745 [Deltaproteobacteria bacterium]|jgi:hypothetical protein|nr:hypothetical protein [Deltaproteobacteria bacterium]